MIISVWIILNFRIFIKDKADINTKYNKVTAGTHYMKEYGFLYNIVQCNAY